MTVGDGSDVQNSKMTPRRHEPELGMRNIQDDGKKTTVGDMSDVLTADRRGRLPSGRSDLGR